MKKFIFTCVSLLIILVIIKFAFFYNSESESEDVSIQEILDSIVIPSVVNSDFDLQSVYFKDLPMVKMLLFLSENLNIF